MRYSRVSLAVDFPVPLLYEGRTPLLPYPAAHETASEAVADEMEGGRGTLLRAGLASVGALM
ncbi:hypothetical protein ASF23_05460 [Curtobacterium sp. Leaf261]|nr:hypothetical protein ASF23_05460 [Curtobacterium sp. Leaf261]